MTTPNGDAKRVAIYCRVSTAEQTAANQTLVLKSFAGARGWAVTEYIDQGVSGAREKRPALDALLAAVRARKVDVVACVKLDRLARSVHHLVGLVIEFEALSVDLIVLDQAIDTTTASGRLLFHVLAAISEFERDLIRDRVLAGLRRARVQGTKSGRRIGRPRTQYVPLERARVMLAGGSSLRLVARTLGVHPTAVSRALEKAVANPVRQAPAKYPSGRAAVRR